MAMHDCDVMIDVGARFDDRVTGRLNAFSPNSKKIHIDIDPSSINKNVRVDVPIVGDAGAALEAIIEGLEGASAAKPDREALGAVVEADRGLARAQLPRLPAGRARSSSRNTRSSGSMR